MARFALYWPSSHDYIVAGAEQLASRGHEVILVLAGSATAVVRNGVVTTGTDDWNVEAYRPDLELYCGWHVPAINRQLRGRSSPAPVRLLYFDTQWQNTIRQVARLPFARMRLTRQFHGCFVPGARQVEFARRLGFRSDRILDGALTFHSAIFDNVPLIDRENASSRRQFIFAGRAVPAKGFDELLAGYARYRAEAEDPWSLAVAGNAEAQQGTHVRYVGFLSHEQLAGEMGHSACLVLPSRFEPYGAIALEAAAAGLLLLLTEQVGAAVDLLVPEVNGYAISRVTTRDVAAALHRLSSLAVEHLAMGSSTSRAATGSFRQTAWADSMEAALAWRSTRPERGRV